MTMTKFLPLLLALALAYVLVRRRMFTDGTVRCDGGMEEWTDRIEAQAVATPPLKGR
jgi:hypothetical protein